MFELLSFLILITPPIIMTSGFGMSLLGALFLIALSKKILDNNIAVDIDTKSEESEHMVVVSAISDSVDNLKSFNYAKKIISLKSIINNYKLEFIFVLWAIYSLVSTVSISELVLSAIKIFSFTYFFLLLKEYLLSNTENSYNIHSPLKWGIIIAIIIFFIEYFSHGIIVSNFRHYGLKEDQTFCFALCYLDRGCAFLSVCYWVLCKILVDKKQYGTAIIFYSIILFLLSISDCLAGLVAFISGGAIFLSIFLNKNFAKIITYLLIIGSFIFPIIAGLSNPQYISDRFNKLPLSAKERIFIWNFVANKIKEHPIKGIGINNSRYIHIPKDERINYQGHIFSQFQLHPHNNIMQIFLELGVIGFFMSLMLVYKYVSRIEDPSIYAAFINYYVIGMISYSIWQSWWFISGVWIYSLLQLVNRKTSRC